MTRSKRIYVLDTNVLMHDPTALFKFEEHDGYLPMQVMEELDNAISLGTRETRLQALWHATDLLITGQFSDEQIWTFGEVIQRLAQEIEVAARSRLSVVPQRPNLDRALTARQNLIFQSNL